MFGFTRELGEASIIRLHPAYVEPGDGHGGKWD